MIYFIQAVDGGPVKIGHTSSLKARLVALESHYGKRFVVLASCKGSRAKEKQIHEMFAHLRFGRTEQFRPAADLMAYIGRPLMADPEPDEVVPNKPARAIFNLPEDVAYTVRIAAAMKQQKPRAYIADVLREVSERDIEDYVSQNCPQGS